MTIVSYRPRAALHLGPHPYEAHSRDAFKQLGAPGNQVTSHMSVTVVVRSVPDLSVPCGT